MANLDAHGLWLWTSSACSRMIRAEVEGSAERPAQERDFASVYAQHVGRVYGFVFSQVGNREEAEDLTSQIFLKVFSSLSRFEGRGSLQGWLFQIARVTVNDHWREKYRLPAVPLPDGLDVAADEVPPDFNRQVRDARVQDILA